MVKNIDEIKLRDASIWRILVIFFCWLILVGIFALFLSNAELNDELSDSLIHISSLGFLIAIIIELKIKRIPFRKYLMPGQQKEWSYLLFFIPLIIASIGLSWLLDFILFKIAPDLLQSRNLWMEQNPIFNTPGSIWHHVGVFITICIVAPFGEEFLFRGIILDKLRNRWSVAAGIMLSSFIFGLLHFDILGAFIFGLVLCLLFLETGSLFVPIGIHFLNNFSAFLLSFVWPESWTTGTDFDYLFEYLWWDIPFLILGSIWIGWFLYSRRSYFIPS